MEPSWCTETMTGDRRLSAQEMLDFKLEKVNHRFDAMQIISKAIVDGNDEPTLFEVALIELAARVDGHTEILKDLSRQVRDLKAQAKMDYAACGEDA